MHHQKNLTYLIRGLGFQKRMRNYLYKDNSARIYMLFEFYRTAIKNYQQSKELYYNTKKMLADSGSSLLFWGVECKIFLGKNKQYSNSNPFKEKIQK